MHIDLVTIVVDDYDEAIRFFVDAVGFTLAEDAPAETEDGRPKRWVVVRPPSGDGTGGGGGAAGPGLLLARADGDAQAAVVGRQVAGRVGFFLHVDDAEAAHRRMVAAGVEFVRPLTRRAYGTVAVFLDVAGNRWDLIGPP